MSAFCVLYNVLGNLVTNQAINTLRAGSLSHVENRFIKNLVRLGKPLLVTFIDFRQNTCKQVITFKKKYDEV